MATFDTLAFSDFDTVTGEPTVDGFVTPDPGVITTEVEPGYVNGSRMTFGGSGFPPVVFQGVKNGNFLHLAFMCRGDLEFDAEDVVVVALAPTPNPAQATTRRIDIFPVWEDVGADETNTVTGGPAGNPDDVPPGVPGGSNFYIRTRHNPAALRFYRGQAAGTPWAAYTPATFTPSPAAAPAGPYQVRVRSWKPAVAGPPDEYAWSIELKIPIDTAAGGADWINLADGFGLYFNVIRLGKAAASGSTPSQGWYSTQFRFPQQVAANTLAGILDASLVIDPTWYGTGLIPALQVPPGGNLGQGVRFALDAWGIPRIGRREAGDATITALGHQISGAVDNELVAVLDNTSPTDAANNVTAEFRFANWGLGAGSFTSWAKPPGLTPNPTPVAPGANLAAGATDVAFVSSWPAASVPTDYAPPKDHQCVWVQLSSTSAVNFVQSSARKNMDFIDLSSVERPAEISGVGYPSPAGGGGKHDFLLFTRARKIILPWNDQKPGLNEPGMIGNPEYKDGDVVYVPAKPAPGDRVTYLWITEGYRRTGLKLTIGSKETEVLDETPGQFGYVAQHQGAADSLRWELAGPGLVSTGPGAYSLPVPHDGTVTIKTRVWTEPPRQGRDHPPHDVDVKKWPWWMWLVLILLVLLVFMLVF
jgi:hypothetical protein